MNFSIGAISIIVTNENLILTPWRFCFNISFDYQYAEIFIPTSARHGNNSKKLQALNCFPMFNNPSTEARVTINYKGFIASCISKIHSGPMLNFTVWIALTNYVYFRNILAKLLNKILSTVFLWKKWRLSTISHSGLLSIISFINYQHCDTNILTNIIIFYKLL